MLELQFFTDKRIAVTGAAGTVGRALVDQLLTLPIKELRALDNAENGLFYMDERYRTDGRMQTFICDVRSYDKLEHLFSGMDLVFHAAALKHVPFAERSPFETVQTNVYGVQNVINAAIKDGVERVMFTSSDKAVNPTNVMGTSKLMGERLITAANALIDKQSDTLFASTRFGNVAGSAGSVIPLFCRQIAAGGPVTVTDCEMTRFLMTVDEAVAMIMRSMVIACGGEVFVSKMPVVNIADLARVLVDCVSPVYGRTPDSIEIATVGPRPGEKLFEELTTEEELRRTLEFDDMFVVLPAFRNIYGRVTYQYPGAACRTATRVYNSASEPSIGTGKIEEILRRPGILPDEIRLQLPHKLVRLA